MVLKHDLQHSLWTQPHLPLHLGSEGRQQHLHLHHQPHLLQLPQADEHTIEYPVH